MDSDVRRPSSARHSVCRALLLSATAAFGEDGHSEPLLYPFNWAKEFASEARRLLQQSAGFALRARPLSPETLRLVLPMHKPELARFRSAPRGATCHATRCAYTVSSAQSCAFPCTLAQPRGQTSPLYSGYGQRSSCRPPVSDGLASATPWSYRPRVLAARLLEGCAADASGAAGSLLLRGARTGVPPTACDAASDDSCP